MSIILRIPQSFAGPWNFEFKQNFLIFILPARIRFDDEVES
jgi:hypothetical protein